MPRLHSIAGVTAGITLTTLAMGTGSALAQGQSGTVLEEVFVVAQKRSQNMQEVPVAVSAFSGEDMKNVGVTEPVNLAAQTPNLSTKNAVGNTAPIFSLRGISLNDFATNGTQPVGVYVDEVYMVNNSQLSFQMFDVERAEILKGPQGTLYGRNTTAGAVSFITRKPSDETEIDASITVGNYEMVRTEAAVGGALTNNLSGRFSFAGERQLGGYFTNDVTGDEHGETKRYGWRGQLLWDATDATSVLLNIHGGIDKSDNWYYSFVADESGLPEGAAIAAADPDDGDIYRGRFNSSPTLDNDSLGATVKVEHDFETVKLTSISSYEAMDYARSEDFDSTVLSAGNNDYSGALDAYSQEVRLTSDGATDWFWIVGAFYGYDKLEEDDVFNESEHPFFYGLVLNEKYKQETTSFALFTHNEIQLSEAWRLTAGLRYTDEERSFVGGTIGFAEIDSEVNYSEWTGKLGVDYLIDDHMIYSSFSRGYKAGGFTGFFTFVPEEKQAYNPEFIDAFELGIKSTLADGAVRLNGAVFHYQYDDLQAFGSKDGFFRIFNIEEAVVIGAEIEMNWLPAEGWRIDTGLAVLDTEVNKSSLAEAPEGNKLGNAADLQFNIAASYEWNLSHRLLAFVGIDASYQDDIFYSISNNPNQLQESYTLANARAGVRDADDIWSVTGWVKNLTDKEYFGEIFSDGALAIGFPAAPRTYGVTLAYRWQ
jgi:iron complex outermembrane recepter protein